MLRFLFHEPKRTDDGQIREANEAIRRYSSRLHRYKAVLPEHKQKQHRLHVRSISFLDALNEIEQSLYCSSRYARYVKSSYIDEMKPEELDHYRRYLYFYKNALIRLFSILDKLGYFLNDVYNVRTETKKPRFSFYTVLRQMHEQNIHPELGQQLHDLKVTMKPAMDKLRKRRNMEIHFVNVEMLDDLMQNYSPIGERIQVEQVLEDILDLEQGFQMVCSSISIAFIYMDRHHPLGLTEGGEG
ncbi:Cthe_2314 family HEPN domain-containing protein [Paenibacillus larvae]|uniref:Cthe-2314-like HEPN domain-containing protein n=1 Tax=Paenibacillus larvae subsp. larvae DSM 25430 TaxID=697284 RepID=V9WA87_9BACL|nr:Cthe_2314 family HEPN domain-containing protein [Paenibacillus larvae]AHD06759.1 hypothetical protein ERIC2_c29770 [Paenibacillus larvae subsp. larvae DSM 25430]AVG13318.1 hypothetical protein ERICII_02976 [Paenibacillus larvae subsp. larvae DSM 25430]MDR5568695.1 Cthe_2314 family HEPN domain-containing protein [Paenibacillus larvae]MDR5597032.1 Cthe_2314 family HEPN domain-containing protein [Paenibacillus larvae]